jgi:hypothetical protein
MWSVFSTVWGRSNRVHLLIGVLLMTVLRTGYVYGQSQSGETVLEEAVRRISTGLAPNDRVLVIVPGEPVPDETLCTFPWRIAIRIGETLAARGVRTISSHDFMEWLAAHDRAGIRPQDTNLLQELPTRFGSLVVAFVTIHPETNRDVLVSIYITKGIERDEANRRTSSRELAAEFSGVRCETIASPSNAPVQQVPVPVTALAPEPPAPAPMEYQSPPMTRQLWLTIGGGLGRGVVAQPDEPRYLGGVVAARAQLTLWKSSPWYLFGSVQLLGIIQGLEERIGSASGTAVYRPVSLYVGTLGLAIIYGDSIRSARAGWFAVGVDFGGGASVGQSVIPTSIFGVNAGFGYNLARQFGVGARGIGAYSTRDEQFLLLILAEAYWDVLR